MTPETLLLHDDTARLRPVAPSEMQGFDVAAAYRRSLAVRGLRMARGEVPRGFEIVLSHLAGWKFRAADTVADGALHARLLVGRQLSVGAVAGSARALDQALGAASVVLRRGGEVMDRGQGSAVLDGPLQALHYFFCRSFASARARPTCSPATWSPRAPGRTPGRWPPARCGRPGLMARSRRWKCALASAKPSHPCTKSSRSQFSGVRHHRAGRAAGSPVLR